MSYIVTQEKIHQHAKKAVEADEDLLHEAVWYSNTPVQSEALKAVENALLGSRSKKSSHQPQWLQTCNGPSHVIKGVFTPIACLLSSQTVDELVNCSFSLLFDFTDRKNSVWTKLRNYKPFIRNSHRLAVGCIVLGLCRSCCVISCK